MNKRVAVCLALSVLFTLPAFVAAQEDEAGCKDHPLFTRMKGFVIYECESSFDAVDFYVGEDKAQTLEGQKTRISYSLPKESRRPPSSRSSATSRTPSRPSAAPSSTSPTSTCP